jgi:hypothetical protein
MPELLRKSSSLRSSTINVGGTDQGFLEHIENGRVILSPAQT